MANNKQQEKEKTEFCVECRTEYKISEMKRRKFVMGIFERKEIID